MEQKKVSRRDFIKAVGFTATAGLLAACAPQVVTQVVNQTQVVVQTQVVPQTQVVQQTQLVNQVVTATPAPTAVPAPAVLDVWWNTTIPDFQKLKDGWKNDPNNEFFKANNFWGGLAVAKFGPFLDKHPGVSLKIVTHNWDSALRQNQYMALAAGIIPDTTYGEAYVNEFVQLHTYSPISPDAAALFPAGPLRGATVDGQVYGLPKSSGADVLFVNLDKVAAAGADPAKLPTTWDELVALAQAISKVNKSAKYGNTAYYTYGPGGDSYGQAMRILHWFNQNNAPLGTDNGVPSANLPASTDTWDFHNQLMWTSTAPLILQAESEGGSGKLFNDGVIALKPGWNNDATSVGDGNINGTAIAFPLPPGGKPATILVGNDIESPFKQAKHPDLAIALVEETTTNPDAQAWLAQNRGIWIPALSSLLKDYATYDKLDGYKTDTAKKIVRVTMQQLLEGNAAPVPGWPLNGSRIWAAFNTSYGNIWKGKLSKADIQKELDGLQKTIQGLLVP
jgi:ABC-type glycerol-3-phosphate transport system substrate-binding protein